MDCKATDQKKAPLLSERHLQARLKYAKDSLEKDYRYWSYDMKLKLFGHRDAAYIWRKKGEMYNPKDSIPHSEMWWWKRYTVGTLQCIWNWESHQGRRNQEE